MPQVTGNLKQQPRAYGVLVGKPNSWEAESPCPQIAAPVILSAKLLKLGLGEGHIWLGNMEREAPESGLQ